MFLNKESHSSLLILSLLSCNAVVQHLYAEATPNVLFIMADDLGISDLGCYGNSIHRTPHIDQLARQGMTFINAYAASTVCSPTRASILTGCFPDRLHLTDALPWDRLPENPKLVPPEHLKELPDRYVTFPEIFQQAEYVTALIGKWHLGNENVFFRQGGHKKYGFDEAVDSSYPQIHEDEGVEFLTEQAVQFLDRNKDNPFFLCLFHHTPHVPLACPDQYISLYQEVPDLSDKQKLYAGMMSYFDDSVQRVLDRLSELGLDKNTIVILTSDNGGEASTTSNAPYRGGKGTLYEGGIRIPLIIRWPHLIKPGSVCSAPVYSVDYFPTFLDAASLSIPPEIQLDGVSMMPLLTGGADREERPFFWYYPHYHQNPQSAVRNGDWKLIHHLDSDTYELFHLSEDPGETTNALDQYPETADRLSRLLSSHLTSDHAQLMRPNPAWDSALPEGKVRNFGVFYPEQGGIYQQIRDPLPLWFSTNEHLLKH